MAIHKPLKDISQRAIDDGLIINLGSLYYDNPKIEVHTLLQGYNFDVEIYWPNFESSLGDSDLGKAVMGWCWIKFQKSDKAERPKEMLSGAMLRGRCIKTGTVVHQSSSRSQAKSRGSGPPTTVPPRVATQASSKHFRPVLAAPSSSATKTTISTLDIFSTRYPEDWTWDPAKPNKFHDAFLARIKDLGLDYNRCGLKISPVAAQRPDEKSVTVPQQVPSPNPCNAEAWDQHGSK
ncbi:hypothetical protein FBEOM_2885 [Fusarium beomiforme]|uniref:Uncharacterized protein n=1 Tax=Fusarium beomiforme TaxID=44412 RepID=A0A9P5AR50_9HYPO|nr:hypothetical protein FBEOM_2885 [Fusarium beomiforme]